MSDQPTGQEATENAVREFLSGTTVAKAHRDGKLSRAEVDRLTAGILSVLPTTPETVSAEVISWYGIDRRNDMLYTGKAKTPIYEKWIADHGFDPKKVRSLKDQAGAYTYSFPRGIGDSEELWVVKTELLPEYLKPEELAKLGIGPATEPGTNHNGTNVTEADIAGV